MNGLYGGLFKIKASWKAGSIIVPIGTLPITGGTICVDTSGGFRMVGGQVECVVDWAMGCTLSAMMLRHEENGKALLFPLPFLQRAPSR